MISAHSDDIHATAELMRRYLLDDPETGHYFWAGKGLADARLLIRRRPAWRGREPVLLLAHGTWAGES